MALSQILFSFEGRISRSTFWISFLGLHLFNYLFLFTVLFLADEKGAGWGTVAVVPFLLWLPALLLGAIAIQAKRWHDRDKSGVWIFICLIPVIGAVWNFIELGCLRGTVGPNEYGPDPLED